MRTDKINGAVGNETNGRAPFKTKGEFVYRTLREEILRCDLQPGARLLIDEVAARLGVSAIPVREALGLLQAERLVEVAPHAGAVVAPVSRQSIVEVFALMEGLEIVATRVLAERLMDEQEAELKALLRLMDAAVQERDSERWALLNADFHRAISRLTAMPTLQEMTERALDLWRRVHGAFFKGFAAGRLDRAQKEHRAIVRLMRARDFDRLEATVKAHNRGALAAYMKAVASIEEGRTEE